MSCWTRRRTSPGASPASLTIWKASSTLVASWSWSSTAFLLSLEGIQRRDLHPCTEVFSALGQPVLVHGARPAWDQVHSTLPWDDPPLEWSTMPVSSRGPSAASVLVMPHASHQPPAPEPPQKRAGSSDAARRHGLMWDHTVFHVVRHIQRRLNHRNLAGTPAQGASITSTTTRPWPCAITPHPGHPARQSQDSMSCTRASGVRATLIRWKPSKPTSRSHRSSNTQQQQQVGPDTARGP